MLDVSVHNLSFARAHFALRDVSITFPRSTHTGIVGPAGCGATTILRIIAGAIRPASGEVRIGSRVVNDVKAARRPLLHATSSIDAPGRWSVRHLLIAAARQRTIDREDRQQEVTLAAAKWGIDAMLDRRLDTLSSSEEVWAHLAQIEILKPAILVADRILEKLNPAESVRVVDEWYRTLRVLGTTVITAPSSLIEIGATDRVVVLDGGRVVRQGVPAEIYGDPQSEAAAMATGDVNVLPITIRGNVVESVIGSWEVEMPAFQGSGIALVRPGDFTLAAAGEESDLIFGVEEACFYDGLWHARGLLSDAFMLRVTLPGSVDIHKGKLMGLRYDATRFRLMSGGISKTMHHRGAEITELQR
ncbi:MAG: sn-glycerol 3-phosphate transport system ATP-binding protein [Thermoanaerobaculia bacterium]|jgi:ABC-type sugar transport system ATPase subunit|nr:sn-glycerol 3-phosphate transport system ATP-binding protein [Thermoanaerobaculia bacterium]